MRRCMLDSSQRFYNALRRELLGHPGVLLLLHKWETRLEALLADSKYSILISVLKMLFYLIC